jgi:hypothetical protein
MVLFNERYVSVVIVVSPIDHPPPRILNIASISFKVNPVLTTGPCDKVDHN